MAARQGTVYQSVLDRVTRAAALPRDETLASSVQVQNYGVAWNQN